MPRQKLCEFSLTFVPGWATQVGKAERSPFPRMLGRDTLLMPRLEA
jgi:hypothetical protein